MSTIDQVGPRLPDQRDELGGVAGLGYYLEARAIQQARQALAEQDIIVRQRDPDRHLGHVTVIFLTRSTAPRIGHPGRRSQCHSAGQRDRVSTG